MRRNHFQTIFIALGFISVNFNTAAQNIEWTKNVHWGTTVIHYGQNNEIFTAGTFSSSDDLDPGEDVLSYPVDYESMFISKFSQEGLLLWNKTIVAISSNVLNIQSVVSVETDGQGNIVLVGLFEGIVDFDPSENSFEMDSGGGEDIFILKLNSAGEFIFAKQIGKNGNVSDLVHDLAIDSSGNIVLVGNFMETLDFDPNSGIVELSSSSNSVDIFVLKLTFSGNLSWVKRIGQFDIDRPGSVSIDANNNIYVTGVFGGTVDFDPGAGVTQFVEGSGVSDAFFLKLNSSGNFVWAGALQGLQTEEGHFVETGVGDDVYFVGRIGGNATLNLNGNTQNIVLEDTFIGKFVLKATSSGTIDWLITSTEGYYYTDLDVDNESSLYLSGPSDGLSTDFDPGAGEFAVNAANDSFVQKLNDQGNFVWVKLQDDNYAEISLVDVNSNADVIWYSDGYYYEFTKLNQDICYNFYAEISSAEGISCENQGLGIVEPGGGLEPYTFSWNNEFADSDNTAEFTVPGIYTVDVSDVNGCQQSKSVYIDGPLYSTGVDVDGNLVSGNFRPGFQTDLVIDIFNNGCISSAGQIKLVLDGLVQFDSSSPSPDQISGDTLIWNFGGITFDSGNTHVDLHLLTSVDAAIGDIVCLTLLIDTDEFDADISNNEKTYCYDVVNGYDPNDKQVYPQGWLQEHFVSNNQEMTYTIRFQNTGNSEAINIFILDSIQPGLDIATLRVVGHSHPMNAIVLEDDVVKFNFENILLPDSASDPLGSQGYVIYAIDQMADLPGETLLENTAGIYFDFNDPIITNTTYNEIFTCDMIGEITSSDFSSCTGNIVLIDPSLSYIESYSWFENEIEIGTEPTLELSNDEAGTQTINMSASNPFCILENLFTIVTAESPAAPIIEDVDGTLTVESDDALQWYFEGESIEGATGNSYTPLESGVYGVSLTNDESCSSYTELEYFVSIDDLLDTQVLSIYPNPVVSEFFVNVNAISKIARLEMMDINGKKVMDVIPVIQPHGINVSNLNPGTYLIRVFMDSGDSYSRMVLIE